MRLIDAHNHLHDARLAPHLREILPTLELQWAVVNGTREDDWPAVASLAAEHAWVLPSFGLHPWQVAGRTPHWLAALRRQLDAHPRVGVGEIGLDCWIEGHALADQTRVFTAQLALAAERNLPATIHCIKAWGALWEIVRTHPLPARGFLMHDVSRLRRSVFDEFMKPMAMTRSQWWILAHLSRHDGMIQSDLANVLDIGKAALGGLIDRLEASRFIL